jgi:hypothetical protein
MADLKVQDKDEITLKKMKADGQDKDGLKEAQLRRSLSQIIDKYGLNEYFKTSEYLDNKSSQFSSNSYSDQYLQKQIFRDKKLDKLWKKAEKSGLNDEQLKILKEEFKHHELKIEQYYQLIDDINKNEELQRSRGQDWENSMNRVLHSEDERPAGHQFNDAHQALKDKHFEIKENFKQLSDRVSKNLDGFKSTTNEFEEENVQKLWELALKSDFNNDELMSLKEELEHYQNRVRKLKFFESQLESDLIAGKQINENNDNIDGDFDDDKHLKKKVKELNHKVNKIHNELESRIMQRHIEL